MEQKSLKEMSLKERRRYARSLDDRAAINLLIAVVDKAAKDYCVFRAKEEAQMEELCEKGETSKRLEDLRITQGKIREIEGFFKESCFTLGKGQHILHRLKEDGEWLELYAARNKHRSNC